MRSLLLGGLVASLLMLPLAANAESVNEKIERAMSAGPPAVAKNATIVDMNEKGKMTVLRKGTNGFTCIPGHPDVVGDNAMCADEASMIWAGSYMSHAKKPANTKPGIVYMLAGGTDWSADDPFATKGTPIKEGPHYMMLWPFDAKKTGLSTKASDEGTWIMYAGTPWAHLMINGKP